MCGWPSGVGFPPGEGELEQFTVAEAQEEAAEEVADELLGAQLDALTTMAERTRPTSDPIEAVAQPETVDAVVPDTVEAASAPQEVPELTMAGGVLTTMSVPPLVDPLTAPIEQVGELGERAASDLREVPGVPRIEHPAS